MSTPIRRLHAHPYSLAFALALSACHAAPAGGSAGAGGEGGATTAGAGGSGAGGGVTSTAGGGGVSTTSTGGGGGAQPDAGPLTGFVHPGVLVDQGQLDFVKGKLAESAEPWTSALALVRASSLASLSYTPQPIATVDCGSYSMPDIGCTAEREDSEAAYTHALLWALGGDPAHAEKSIAIMNAWAAVLKAHTNTNAPLQSAWFGAVFPRAAEIMRAYPGWAAADVAAFGTLLRDVYLPEVIHGAPADNGNWELSMAEATMAIGVFLDDQATFAAGVAMWRARVPAYVYLQSDGPLPVPPPGGLKTKSSDLISFWEGQTTFVDGLCQETCRDLGHTQLGFAAMINAAETAKIQGIDLYGEESKRITAGYEFNAQFLDGAPVPSWLCGGTLSAVTATETWEIGYNAYATRAGLSLPHTLAVVNKVRPTGVNHMMVWETLTHAGIGNAGLQ